MKSVKKITYGEALEIAHQEVIEGAIEFPLQSPYVELKRTIRNGWFFLPKEGTKFGKFRASEKELFIGVSDVGSVFTCIASTHIDFFYGGWENFDKMFEKKFAEQERIQRQLYEKEKRKSGEDTDNDA